MSSTAHHGLAAAEQRLVELELFGIAFADRHYRVLAVHGSLSQWLVPGTDLTQECIAFVGLEEELALLVAEPSRRLTLPDFTFSSLQQEQFYTVLVQWDPRDERFVIVTTQVQAKDDYLISMTQLARAKDFYEQQLDLERKHFRTIYENTPHHLLCFLLCGKLHAATHAFSRVFLGTDKAPTALNVHDELPSTHPIRVLKDSGIWQQVCAGESIENRLIHVVNHAGEPQDLEVSALLLPHSRSQPEAYFTLTDVTARNRALSEIKSHASELEAVSERLRASNQRFERFARVAAHDLLAPLRRISKLSLMIDEDHDSASDSIRVAIAEISKAAYTGRKLVNDVMALSKVSSMNSAGQRLCPEDVMREVAEESVFDLEEVGGAIVYCGEPLTVLGDENLLLQIYRNLLSNAIKYRSPERPLRITHTLRQDAQGRVRMCFSDNGLGFDSEKAKVVFDPFVRLVDNQTAYGSGIGLAIVKEAADALGCEISAQSSLGVGTKIRLCFPVSAPA